MKKPLFFVLLIALVLTGCRPAQPTMDANLIYTQAAETVGAQLTAVATLTPPTPTATETQTPEPTATETQTPEPTLEPTEAWVNHNDPTGKVTAPILLYNIVADSTDDDPYYQWESPLNVSSTQFEQEMMALRDLGYTSITVSQLAKVMWEGGLLPPRPVLITFDTNKLGVYKKAFPIMKQVGFVGTVYVVVNQLNGNGVMTNQQLQEMVAAGWEIGSKGMTGNNLVDILANNPESLGDEISGSRLKLEEVFGVPVNSFSYPGGAIDGEGKITSRVQSWGYRSAAGVFKSVDHSLASIYFLARYEIRKDLPLEDFLTILPWKGDKSLSPQTISIGTSQPAATVESTPGAETTVQP